MQVSSSWRSVVLNIVFTLLAGLGILMALLGIGAELLPGAHPGLNLPQILLIAAGLLLSLIAFRLRHADGRRRALGTMRRYWAPGLAISVITLLALEFVLGAMDRPLLYFPPDPPEELLDPLSRWTCDETGCRFNYDAMVAKCENGGLSGRYCTVNRQGFHDAQDFVAGDDFDERMRILMLGDSFTFGLTADIGSSYVETIEANFPQSIVWNTGIPRAGTEQALALFQVYAPILQPQITILGFFTNDFGDNLLPMDIDLWLAKKDGRIFMRRHADGSGNAITPDDQKDYYYRAHGVEPPGSEIERLIGRTRLGSLLLQGIAVARGEVPFRDISREVDVTREYLKTLRDAAAARDTALLVLLIPDWQDISPPPPGAPPLFVLDEFRRLLRQPLRTTDKRYQNAVQLMEELKIPYLNPIHALDPSDYMPDPDIDKHWNSAGHQKIGAMLSDCIEAFQITGDLSDCEQVKMP